MVLPWGIVRGSGTPVNTMAERVTIQTPDGDETWIEFSNAAYQAAMEYALHNNLPPTAAFEELYGLKLDTPSGE